MNNTQRLAAYEVALMTLKNLQNFPKEELAEKLEEQISNYERIIHGIKNKQIELEETLTGR